ncbi:Monocarboxylate transporter 13 (MCT 13) (Solute carrier family 16 member 13) [Durusdinium trenchii]
MSVNGEAKGCWKCWPEWLDSELLQHWRQVLGAWIVFFVTAGLTYHAPPVMLSAIKAEFGVDAYEIAWLGAIFQLCKGLLTMPGGYALYRYGCRTCLRAGAVVILISSVLYPLAPSLWCLACLHGLYGSAYDLIGVGPIIVFATTWFEIQPALAISILVTAFSFSGMCFPPIVAYFTAHYGWRQASLMCPILTALIVVPICFGVLHDGPLAQRPTDRPFSSVEDEDTDSTAGRGTARRLDFWRSLRLGAVWHLAFMSLYQLYIIIALINTLTLCLKMDVHMDLQVSAMYSSIVFVTSIAGKLFMGAAMDSKFQGIAGMLSCFLLFLGTLLPLDFSQAGGSLTRSHTQLLAFAMVYGMGFGGTYSLLSAKPAKLLGRMADFGKLQGFLMLFQVIGGFLGTLVTGKLRDLSGSYTWSFYVFIIMAFLACCHYAALEAGSRSTLQAIAESQEA